jgi:universal stress protein family protein
MVEADRLDAKLIVRTVRKRGCDSIVIGTRLRTARRHGLFGSVTDDVFRRSHCPVIVVAAPARQVKDPAHEIADQLAARNSSSRTMERSRS